MQGCSEFDLIARHLSHLGISRDDVMLGVGDDAAVVTTAGKPLAMALDTIVEGVHFPANLPARCVGWRALAVNLSDLAAMGAVPCWALLGLTLPQVDEGWVAEFAEGIHTLACQHNVAVIGGDVTRGPLSITVQLTGELVDTPLRRDGVKPGDRVWVSGAPGQAAAGLKRWQAKGATVIHEPLLQRFLYPIPRVSLGIALQGVATAAIDISDGLLADAGHLAKCSNVSLVLDPMCLASFANGQVDSHSVLRGGDDYELCFTAPPDADERIAQIAEANQMSITCIGVAVHGQGVWLDDEKIEPVSAGYQHF